MAQRRAPAKNRAPSTAPGDEFDFLATQQSTGSDDQAMQLAIAQQVMDNRGDRRNEKYGCCDGDIHGRGRVDREKAFQKFVFDYTAVEDTIRALWMEIKKEEQTLIALAKKRRTTNETQYLATEKGQVAGMGGGEGGVPWCVPFLSPAFVLYFFKINFFPDTRRIMETVAPAVV
ncbi:hypothetical protein MSAN_01076600 [Mycena sanguinolenta]|uniref:Uncharacterized protein n=1 Tax=Mycena sanguinolenta TaxID=230812 RepID=A0A8H6YN27_9AGAR|nr:hypothetical protein MSAN_01076600 [Mycena sanguinolenta]